MDDLNKRRRSLQSSLTEDAWQKYFNLFKQWLNQKITKIEFETAIRKVMTNEQIRLHNRYTLALFAKQYQPITKNSYCSTDEGTFELADYTEYVPCKKAVPPAHLEFRSASSELFLPNTNFIKTQVEIHLWENDLDGAGEGVAELLVHACHTFAKNILTAMISRKRGYKIKDGKLQYGFGLPVPDPFIRNSDNSKEYKNEVNEDGSRESLEVAEHRAAFSYSCGKRKRCDEKLTVQLLYDTLRENPDVIGLHSVYSLNLLKLGIHIGE